MLKADVLQPLVILAPPGGGAGGELSSGDSASRLNECLQPVAPAARHPRFRTKADHWWALAACHLHTPTTANSRSAIATCNLCSPRGSKGFPSSRRRKSPEGVQAAVGTSHSSSDPEQMPTAGGHQPLVIVGRGKRGCGLSFRDGASCPNEGQQPGAPAARHPRSQTNTDSRWAAGVLPAVDLLLS